MIKIDLHTHTKYSHGSNTVLEMFQKGQEIGLKVHGFSEHSPRPLGYDYIHSEYRDKLIKHLPDYVREVNELKTMQHGVHDTKILFGMEVDWIEKEEAFIKQTAQSFDFDYLIGGIHFLGSWGFDAKEEDWAMLTHAQKTIFFEQYYMTMQRMAKTKLFNIVAHPDLIKIFAVKDFHSWLEKSRNLLLVEETLNILKENNMAMEISSAGLRKPCKEIYPCEPIMALAQKIQIPITFASDGHCVNTIGADFDKLALYAQKYGYKESVYFEKNEVFAMGF